MNTEYRVVRREAPGGFLVYVAQFRFLLGPQGVPTIWHDVTAKTVVNGLTTYNPSLFDCKEEAISLVKSKLKVPKPDEVVWTMFGPNEPDPTIEGPPNITVREGY